jgi:hypothetical protein
MHNVLDARNRFKTERSSAKAADLAARVIRMRRWPMGLEPLPVVDLARVYATFSFASKIENGRFE